MVRAFPTGRDLTLTVFNSFCCFMLAADELSEDFLMDFLIYLFVFFQRKQINEPNNYLLQMPDIRGLVIFLSLLKPRYKTDS